MHTPSLDVDLTVYWPFLILGLLAIVVWAGWKRHLAISRPDRIRPPGPGDWDEFDHNNRAFGDRRMSHRRPGGSVPLLLSPSAYGLGGRAGVVLDRSTGGLRIASDVEVRSGQRLHVMAEVAPPGTPWVPVTVRNCTTERDRFVLGCQFETTPPWNVLLLFG
jgi:hypothetical protein